MTERRLALEPLSLLSGASVLAIAPVDGGAKNCRLSMNQSSSVASFFRGQQQGNARQDLKKGAGKERLCGRVRRLCLPGVKLNLRPQKGKMASEVIGGFQAVDGVDWTHGRVFRKQ